MVFDDNPCGFWGSPIKNFCPQTFTLFILWRPFHEKGEFLLKILKLKDLIYDKSVGKKGIHMIKRDETWCG